MDNVLDLIGIGIGPFNLSLAALLDKEPRLRSLFLDKKPRFDWHSEILFADSDMQTNYMKDLVTPVDPTSSYSFLNYISKRGLFYHFLNTQRTNISRREFEQYCIWVSEQLQERLRFNTEVYSADFKDGLFVVETDKGFVTSKNICVATGLVPRVPECAKSHLGQKVFHAKSRELAQMNLTGKTVAIIGGGQTGVEIFRNAIMNKWGRAEQITLISRRNNLEPLDESAFTNEYFTPGYVNEFWTLPKRKKESLVSAQKLASDGNTPSYLQDLYRDLYRLRYIENDSRSLRILPSRALTTIASHGSHYVLHLTNTHLDRAETVNADIVILATGFSNAIPKLLEPLVDRISFDEGGRFQFQKNYAVRWDGPKENKIYALNFSRHNHGVMDPQTSLMAWRSAVVANDLTGRALYNTECAPNFITYAPVNDDASTYLEIQ